MVTAEDGVRIEKIMSNCVLADWNRNNSDLPVKPNDKVVQVNGKVGGESVKAELATATELDITIERKADFGGGVEMSLASSGRLTDMQCLLLKAQEQSLVVDIQRRETRNHDRGYSADELRDL